MMKKIIWTVVVVIAAGLIIYSLTKDTSNSQNTEIIKIGAVLPMTGIAANYGENHLNAIKLAVEEINAKGGVLGRNFEIVSEDDGTDPKKTVSGFQKLTDIDKAPVVIGAVWDFLANAAMPVIESKKIVTISPSAAPDTLDVTADTFFTTFPPISIHQPIIEKYLKNESGKKVAIIYINNAWGKAHRDTYKKAAETTGKTVVKEVELPKFDNNDIQREITLLKTLKPDILMVAGNVIDPKLIIEKNKELGLNARIFGHDNIVAVYASQGIRKDALKDVVVYRLSTPSSDFTQKYVAKYGKNPISEADKAYDAVYVIAEAIKNSKDITSQGIVDGMRQISNFNGASGPLDYTNSNWPTTETARLEIFDGNNFVEYKK